MTEMTREQLISAIHQADSLGELKKQVGPTEREQTLNTERLQRIDIVWDQATKKYGIDIMDWPSHTAERYNSLMDEQQQFEEAYC